jgi:hypothetical protein
VFSSLVSGLHLVLSALGLAAPGDFASVGAIGVAIAVVSAAIVIAALLSLTLPPTAGSSPPHPVRAIDVSSSPSQSDPDASGHARPRAPGFGASAA